MSSLTPVLAAAQSLVDAHLLIVQPPVDEPLIPLRFNPTEYRIAKGNNFAQIDIPGLSSPPLQFVRGAAETLTVDFLLDTSDTLDDVRERYVTKLRGLMGIQEKLHAPPIVAFVWDKQVFKGVIESMDVSYVLFSPTGVPLRANVSATLKEYRPVAVQVKEEPRSSPDVEKSYVVRRGETLASIAYAAYRDPARWRDIAHANGIADPRRIDPGRVLTLPALR
jgi:Contractile injection system tube protein/LysM domain